MSNTKPGFITITTAIISTIGAIIAVFIQVRFSKTTEIELSQKIVKPDIEEKFEGMRMKINHLDSILSQLIIIEGDEKVITLIGNEFKETSKTLQNIYEELNPLRVQLEGLRQSINPINPDEVLTIVRLKDEIVDLKEDLVSYKEKMDNQQSEFRDFILREKETSNRATNLILVVLIPLVINFLYTVWKDLKKSD